MVARQITGEYQNIWDYITGLQLFTHHDDVRDTSLALTHRGTAHQPSGGTSTQITQLRRPCGLKHFTTTQSRVFTPTYLRRACVSVCACPVSSAPGPRPSCLRASARVCVRLRVRPARALPNAPTCSLPAGLINTAGSALVLCIIQYYDYTLYNTACIILQYIVNI